MIVPLKYCSSCKKYKLKDEFGKSTFFNSGLDHKVDLWYGATDEDHASADVWNVVGFAWTLYKIQHGKLPCKLDDRPISHELKGHLHCEVGDS